MKLSHPLENRIKWDRRFYSLCVEISKMSSCLSRSIGAIIVRDNTIVSTGYNGPPRGIVHCGEGRLKEDYVLSREFQDKKILKEYNTYCPRAQLGYKSGEGLHLCPASHAEENAIVNAARIGVSTYGTTIYMNCGTPCKDCMKKIINAGIKELVCASTNLYDEMSKVLLNQTNIKLREFLHLEKL